MLQRRVLMLHRPDVPSGLTVLFASMVDMRTIVGRNAADERRRDRVGYAE